MKQKNNAVKKDAKQAVSLESRVSTEYNGKPTLVLNPEQRFPFQFQIAKAKLILENLALIREFVEVYGE